MTDRQVNPQVVETYEIGEWDHYFFGEGTHYELYKKLGAHPVLQDGVAGVYFAVWAPGAKGVSVTGDFNQWKSGANPMERTEPLGIYTCFIPGIQVGALYKFCIETQTGELLYKADPFANYAQFRPGTASRVTDLSALTWTDGAWLAKRKAWHHASSPVSIYEAHIGSWKRRREGEGERFYNYREFAHEAAQYLEEMGYTHIELLGIAEHPLDGSWGYQVTGYFAPTARYGTPADFAYMVEYFHNRGIGVILDWVPGHFPKDEHGLAKFDGTPLFEYADPRRAEQPEWGTLVFDYGKSEVQNFLIASALFWVEQFHVDGLRVDAVASMLYLDYGRTGGDWVSNRYGGNENLEAVEFLRRLNQVVRSRNPGVMMIAEESTIWPKVTGEPAEDCLGFSMKWNMGWMNDFLEYLKLTPVARKNAHYRLTYPLEYAYNEEYMLVLSHDEVVHLKASMLEKMPGEGFAKYANLQVAYAFMMGFPGKKLLFMGQEFGQKREWSEERELDWYLLSERPHRQVQQWFRALLMLYKTQPALWEWDTKPEGFRWLNKEDREHCTMSFLRTASHGEQVVFLCNFSPQAWPEYRVGVPKKTTYRVLLENRQTDYGGAWEETEPTYEAEAVPWDGQPYSILYTLPAYGAVIFACEDRKESRCIKKLQ